MFDTIDREINYMINLGILNRDGSGAITNKLIPHNIIKKYRDQFKNVKTSDNYKGSDKNTDII